MVNKQSRSEIRVKKHRRLRHHLVGTAQRPRLSVFRSNNHIGITEVVFDRGGFIYQGKIQALADAAREAGLKF